MYKVYFTKESQNYLDSFFDYLKDYFTKLFTDTGIEDENKIIFLYITSTNLLHELIINKITEIGENGLLGRFIIKKEKDYEICRSILNIKSYTIQINSKKFIKEKILIIESIKIFR